MNGALQMLNHDLWMTLSCFMARSTWVTYAYECGSIIKCHLVDHLQVLCPMLTRGYVHGHRLEYVVGLR